MASMKNETRFVDWANIEGDVLRCIADMTDAAWDLIRMAAVCRSWQASLANKRIKFPICLMLTEGYYSNKHCFYSISEAIFDVLYLPEIQGRRCWGSPFGWLVTYALDFETRLFNPFSRTRIPLPSLSTIDEEEDYSPGDLFYSLRKLILCTSPEESDCIVLANTWDGCFFAKPSDEAWTLIGLSDHSYLDDAIYFKGNFYGCLRTGEIVLCEATHPKVVEFAPPPPDLRYFYPNIIIKYLFDLGGNLCIACRRVDTYYVTLGFAIFKLDMDTKSWEKIYSLDDRSLFLGKYCSTFAIAAADYPGCKPNCIYFSDDRPLLGPTTHLDAGIYDCQNLKLEKLRERNSDFRVRMKPFPKSKDGRNLLLSSFSHLWIIPFPYHH